MNITALSANKVAIKYLTEKEINELFGQYKEDSLIVRPDCENENIFARVIQTGVREIISTFSLPSFVKPGDIVLVTTKKIKKSKDIIKDEKNEDVHIIFHDGILGKVK